jgi:hypothetical protein
MSLRLSYLKIRLREEYLRYRAEADRLSCGATLANHITGGRLDALRDRCNVTLAEIKKLDPTCNVSPLT